jgi:hypothetical protein
MTVSEVKAAHPSVSERERDEVGRSMMYLSARNGGEALKGIDSLLLYIFGGRVFQINAHYDQEFENEGIELLKFLGLSKDDSWLTVRQCQEFTASMYQYSDKTLSLTLVDSLADSKVTALTKALEENASDCQNAPVIRQAELRMPLARFKALYPRAQVIRNRRELGELVLHSVNGGDPRLQGISDLWAYFVDGELYFLIVDYSSQIKWQGLEQFVEQFSKGVGLRTKWEGEYTDNRTLRCHSFIASAEMKNGHPRVMIQDRAAVAKLSKREEQLKSPASFRP